MGNGLGEGGRLAVEMMFTCRDRGGKMWEARCWGTWAGVELCKFRPEAGRMCLAEWASEMD
jgi:hypothetical protein